MKDDCSIAELKARFTIVDAWAALNLPGTPGTNCKSPFRDDHRASFSVYEEGRKFMDHATRDAGDVVDFLKLALQCDTAAAVQWARERTGGRTVFAHSPRWSVSATNGVRGASSREQERPRVELPPLTKRSVTASGRLMSSRSISFGAVDLALRHRALGFGEVCGQSCWVLSDDSRRAVEARRVDRLPFPAMGDLGERKAHSVKGTDKSWPVGADLLRVLPSFRAVMLVEGGPDFLAGLHFIYEREAFDVWPCAMLGRSVGGIHKEALALLAGRRVRIYPHADADGGGVVAGKRWFEQLVNAGCEVDGFSFAGMRQCDGSPVKDLNDACLIADEDKARLEGLLP